MPLHQAYGPVETLEEPDVQPAEVGIGIRSEEGKDVVTPPVLGFGMPGQPRILRPADVMRVDRRDHLVDAVRRQQAEEVVGLGRPVRVVVVQRKQPVALKGQHHAGRAVLVKEMPWLGGVANEAAVRGRVPVRGDLDPSGAIVQGGQF